MSGKCIRVINSAQSKWKHIPVLVGGKAPKRNDLIEFEELESYDTEVVSLVQESSAKRRFNKSNKENACSRKTQKNNKVKSKSQNKTIDICVETARRRKTSAISKSRNANQELARKSKVKMKTTKLKNLSSDKSDSVEVDRKLSTKRKAKTKIIKAKKRKLSLCSNSGISNSDISCDELNIDMSQWNGLFIPFPILKALCDLGFQSPLPIQKKVMHAAITEKRDILGAAETGSGKTLAFGIPLLHHLMEDKARNTSSPHNEKTSENELVASDQDEDFSEADVNALVQAPDGKYLPALVLTPTRELALQVMKHLKKVAKYCEISIVAVVGGMAPQKQIRLLKKGPDIVVATPGRMWELINDDEISYLSNMHLLRYLVIDEADRMLEQGHFEDLTKLLELINNKDSNEKRQTYVFSATLTTTHVAPHRSKQLSGYQSQTKEVKLSKLMKKIGIRTKPHVVDLTTKKVVAEALSEGKIICEYTNKDFYLYYFLKSFPGRTLVFANSIDCIFRLSALFELLGCKPLHIHAKMQQRQRLKHLERFQDNPNAIMFASDVAARGLDIPNVRHVIHYQTPRTMETYVHRSGRCARSGKVGYALMLISPQELNLYKKLCRNLDRDDGIPDFVVDDAYMGAIRKRVFLARELDSTLHQQKKSDLDNSWFSKNADAIGVELDDDMTRDAAKFDKSLVAKQRSHLRSLLATPIFPAGFSGKFLTKHGELTLPGIKQNIEKKKQKRR